MPKRKSRPKVRVGVADNGINPRKLYQLFPGFVIDMAEKVFPKRYKKTGFHATQVAYVLMRHIPAQYKRYLEVVNIPIIPTESEAKKYKSKSEAIYKKKPPVGRKLKIISRGNLNKSIKYDQNQLKQFKSLNLDIINCSYGLKTIYPKKLYQYTAQDYWKKVQSYKNIFQKLSDNGVIIVKAAGNYDTRRGEVSVNYNDQIADLISVYALYSDCFGCFRATPGSNNLIAARGTYYTIDQYGNTELSFGTSVAAPFITALVYLMKISRPNLTVSEIKDILVLNAKRIDWRDKAESFPPLFFDFPEKYLKTLFKDVQRLSMFTKTASGHTLNGKAQSFTEAGFGFLNLMDIYQVIADAKYYRLINPKAKCQKYQFKFKSANFNFRKDKAKIQIPFQGCVKEITVKVSSTKLCSYDIKSFSITSPSKTSSWFVTESTNCLFMEKVLDLYLKANPKKHAKLKYSKQFLNKLYKKPYPEEYYTQQLRNEPTQVGNSPWVLSFNLYKHLTADLDITVTMNIDKTKDPRNSIHKIVPDRLPKEKRFYISDHNGGIDTLYFPGSHYSAVINLNRGGSILFKDQFDSFHGVIDKDSDIENIVAGQKDDILVGNDLNNRIFGLGGNDHLSPGQGRDILHGGIGFDTVGMEMAKGKKGTCTSIQNEEILIDVTMSKNLKFRHRKLPRKRHQLIYGKQSIIFGENEVHKLIIQTQKKSFRFAPKSGLNNYKALTNYKI